MVAALSPQDEVVLMARIAESAGRYEDMANFMTERVEMGSALSQDEREMFSAAFKSAMTSRRSAVRIARAINLAKEQEGNAEQAGLAMNYMTKMEAQLREICSKAVRALEGHLLPNVGQDLEAQVYYLKMQGDYYRYLSENTDPASRGGTAQKAKQAYSSGLAEALKLRPGHPTYLGLVLNFSVFLHEVMGDTSEAVMMAQKVLGEFTEDILAGLDANQQEEVLQTLQLLQQNLSLWGPA
mmetsp:Transcript_60287/g.169005  ORF Transcript_60287/g.169005 Transcript_60287/m.169005 type:complete len:240 (+) Transcript_60287:74-793(+)